MAIDEAEVRRIAHLARLELEPSEIALLGSQLGTILDHVRRLDRLDVRASSPTSSMTEADRPLREDASLPSLSAEKALRGAPDQGNGHFRVPRVLAE